MQTDLYTQSRNEVRDISPLAVLEELGLPHQISSRPTFSQHQESRVHTHTLADTASHKSLTKTSSSAHELPRYSGGRMFDQEDRSVSSQSLMGRGPDDTSYRSKGYPSQAGYGEGGQYSHYFESNTGSPAQKDKSLGRVDRDEDLGMW